MESQSIVYALPEFDAGNLIMSILVYQGHHVLVMVF